MKLHPESSQEFSDPRVAKIDNYSSMQLLSIADYVVSDYSAIIYEAFLADKAVFLFTFDEEDYLQDRGLYTPFSEIPAKTFSNPGLLMSELVKDSFDFASAREFIDSQVVKQQGNSAAIVDLIAKPFG